MENDDMTDLARSLAEPLCNIIDHNADTLDKVVSSVLGSDDTVRVELTEFRQLVSEATTGIREWLEIRNKT